MLFSNNILVLYTSNVHCVSPQWDQRIDVTITQILIARPTTAVCPCGLYATATMTAETTVMSRAVVRTCLFHGSDLKIVRLVSLYQTFEKS